MQDEMATHIELASERLIARGLSPIDAHLAATREFGNMTHLKEEAAGGGPAGSRHCRRLTLRVRHSGGTPPRHTMPRAGDRPELRPPVLVHARHANHLPLGVAESDDLVRTACAAGSERSAPHLRTWRAGAGGIPAPDSHFSAVTGYAKTGYRRGGWRRRQRASARRLRNPHYFEFWVCARSWRGPSRTESGRRHRAVPC